MRRVKTAVLISGNGSNLQALIDASRQPGYPAEIVLVISNVANAYGLARASQAHIPTLVIPHKQFDSREAFDTRMAEVEARFADREVPRPEGWSGYRVAPDAIEFWYGAQFRLHERWRYECDAAGVWSKRMLFP